MAHRLVDKTTDNLSRFDYTYMELVDAPAEISVHQWCKFEPTDDPESDASLDRGKVHVGGLVRSLRDGQVVDAGAVPEAPPDRPTPTFRPHQRRRSPKKLTVDEVEAIKAKGGRRKRTG